MLLTRRLIDDFLASHRLPGSFRQLIDEYYAPLTEWIADRAANNRPLLLGINGAQGSGKSTLADFLKLSLETQENWRVAVLSIDDFYLTRAERERLADDVHPLFATRGAPGTHDIDMLRECLDRLRTLKQGEQLKLPRFDKANDDRAARASWPTVDGPLDLVILEGWCVGSAQQSNAELTEPLNALERNEDREAVWRRYANDRLKTDYDAIFSEVDALVFLQVPDFESVYRWRLEQERKLATTATDSAAGVMDERQLARFIQFYQRITENNLRVLPRAADVVLELDRNHACASSRYNS